MSDEDANNRFNSFDREPPTSSTPQPDTTEHADLNHRLEADSSDEQPTTTQFGHASAQPTPAATPAIEQPAAVPVTPVASAPVAPVAASELPHAGPGLMVLQWLTYAFWGWTVLSLSGLVLLVVNQLMTKIGSDGASMGYWFGGGIAYLLAAVLVLFVIALICDIFYSRAEKKHARSSGTNVIMIIHAVIFALFGIGALIMSVFGVVSLMIADTTDAASTISTIISGAIIFVLYGLTLLRTLRPSFVKGVVPMYWGAMTLAIIVSVILGVVGPAATARLQSQDLAVEQGLPGVARAINDYTDENSKLPATLSDLDSSLSDSGYNEEANELIEKDSVRYTPGERIVGTEQNVAMFSPGSQLGGTVATAYGYTLCVTYKAADDSGVYNSSPYTPEGQKYPTSIETYGHRAGEVCYDLQTADTN
ncbi:MAG: DUF2304 domain-containing protein [Patescibacteria group bacterium]